MEAKEQELRAEFEQLEEQMQNTALFATPEYPRVAKRHSWIKNVLDLYDHKGWLEKHLKNAEEILANEKDSELIEMAKEEIKDVRARLDATDRQIEEVLIPHDPNDERDAIVEIRAAAGG